MRRGARSGGMPARQPLSRRVVPGVLMAAAASLLVGVPAAIAQTVVPPCVLLCGTPTPAPTATATARPAPTASAPPAAPPATPPPTAPPGQPAPAAGAAPPAAPGGSAPPRGSPTPSQSASPSPRPGSGGLAAVGIVDDPALAGQVSAILAHPATADRPFLHHFLVGQSGGSGASRGGGSAGAGRTAGHIALAILLMALLGLAASATLRRRLTHRGDAVISRQAATLAALRSLLHRFVDLRRARRWAPRLAVLALALPVSVYVAAGVSAAGGVIHTARTAALPARTQALQTRYVTRLPVRPAVRSAAWTALVGIERSLAEHQLELARQEAALSSLSHPRPTPSPTTAPPAATATPPAAAPSSPAIAGQLARIVDRHQAELAAYQAALESEYQLFAAAAADPNQSAVLLAAASSAGPAPARDAVAFDLSAVQAQLAQDSAISAAAAQNQAAAPASRLRATGRPQLIPPLNGALTQGFGPTDLDIEAPATHDGVFYPHFHTGLDISAPLDTPVHAAADGKVILATASVDAQGRLVGYGNFVVIAHAGGLITVYGHLDSIAVKGGQMLRQGDVIGLEGSTGNSTGPHVHFETRLGGGIVDPTPYLGGFVHQ